jgi:FMN-dependent NADH-azoreductase
MPTLLNVQSSPNLMSSGSRAVSKAFVDKYVANNPGTKVVDLDLVLNPPKHIGPDHLRAFFTPPETHEAANTAALNTSNAYVDQLLAADVLVLGTPMHNFGISSTMKSWIDNIIRVGRTFKYTESGPVGLVPGKKVVIAVGSGGIYSDGPFKAFEHAGNYLRDILATLGLTDITILRAEGSALGPEAAARGLAAGIAAAEKAAT